MQSCIALEDAVLATMGKTFKDEGSTTEEETNSAVGSGTSDSEDADLEIAVDTEEEYMQEALRQYGARFGRDAEGHCHGMSEKPTIKMDNAEQSNRCDEKLLAELEFDLGVHTNQDVATMVDEELLNPTFGYAGSLDEQPPYAKYDIRDHICMNVGGFTHGQLVRTRRGAELVVIGVKVAADGEPHLWFQPQSLGRPAAGAYRDTSPASLQMRLQAIQDKGKQQLCEMKPDSFEGGEDSDGEETISCLHCRLPVGFQCFSFGDSNAPVHAECYAQLMQKKLKQEDEARQRKEATAKKHMREEYDIGWNPEEEVPRNMMSAMKLGCESVPRGMCSVVLDPETDYLKVAPTLEPAESVNLEYLSLALKVRMLEGREPLFSLDVLASEGQWEKDMMQEKCFEPAWLAGTSVGEVLFQADYHLKELSMGEYEQPVVGMKSCADFTEQVDAEDWNAREWFIVRHAEVLMTEANTLIPRVKMGIEAREQVVGPDGMEDKAITRTSHPLVKYAEQFTHFFDLIAERKSVIYHLRDLAKASVLAKMIVESDVNLEAPWLELGGDAKEVLCMEIPQIWNHQVYSQVQVRDGEIKTAADKQRTRGLYGGVEFGLDKVQVQPMKMVSMAGAPEPRPSVSISAPPSLSLKSKAVPPPDVRAPLVAPLARGAPAAPAAGAAPGAAPAAVSVRPLMKPVVGIESMTTPTRDFPVASRKGAIALAVPVPTPKVTPDVKLPAVAVTTQRPTAVPQKVKVPSLPPKRLGLISMTPVKSEIPRGVDLNLDQFSLSEPTLVEGRSWDDASRMKCANMGADFWSSIQGGSEFRDDDKALLQTIFNPKLSDRRVEGELFVPPETTPEYVAKLRSLVDEEKDLQEQRKQQFFSTEFSVANPGPLFPTSWVPSVEIIYEKTPCSNLLHSRPDYAACTDELQQVLNVTTPVFDKSAEDGVRFRIYTIGNLEVRTTQNPESNEVVGAVLSTNAPIRESPAVNTEEKISTVSEYIEKSQKVRRSYIVLETVQGNIIVTEKLENGAVTWQENRSNLEARNAQAKLIRTADCSMSGVTVACMKQFRATQCELYASVASSSEIKCYAQGAFSRAVNSPASTGFKTKNIALKWQL